MQSLSDEPAEQVPVVFQRVPVVVYLGPLREVQCKCRTESCHCQADPVARCRIAHRVNNPPSRSIRSAKCVSIPLREGVEAGSCPMPRRVDCR